MESLDQSSGIEVSEESRIHLASIRKWALFLSIMGFIGCGFMLLTGLFFGTMSRLIPSFEGGDAFPGMLMLIVYTIMAVVYFIPSLFLFKFSLRLKASLDADASGLFSEALKFLRFCFTSVGLLTITGICLFILIMLSAIVFAIFTSVKGV